MGCSRDRLGMEPAGPHNHGACDKQACQDGPIGDLCRTVHVGLLQQGVHLLVELVRGHHDPRLRAVYLLALEFYQLVLVERVRLVPVVVSALQVDLVRLLEEGFLLGVRGKQS
jgi:hypothetical protein